jgi:hypothetical protein
MSTAPLSLPSAKTPSVAPHQHALDQVPSFTRMTTPTARMTTPTARMTTPTARMTTPTARNIPPNPAASHGGASFPSAPSRDRRGIPWHAYQIGPPPVFASGDRMCRDHDDSRGIPRHTCHIDSLPLTTSAERASPDRRGKLRHAYPIGPRHMTTSTCHMPRDRRGIPPHACMVATVCPHPTTFAPAPGPPASRISVLRSTSHWLERSLPSPRPSSPRRRLPSPPLCYALSLCSMGSSFHSSVSSVSSL